MERIGITYWSGKPTHFVEKFIIHNATFFDKFYLVSIDEWHYLPKNVYQLRISNEELITNYLGADIYQEYGDIMTPGSISDIVFHFARSIVPGECGPVMYTDTNSILMNEFLVNQIFECSVPYKMLVKYCEGFRPNNGFSNYISADWGLDYKSPEEDDDVRSRLVSKINDGFHYTTMGPSFMNSIIDKVHYYKLLEDVYIDDVPYGQLVPGIMEFKTGKNSMGIGFSNSFLKLNKLEATDFIRSGNRIFINFERV